MAISAYRRHESNGSPCPIDDNVTSRPSVARQNNTSSLPPGSPSLQAARLATPFQGPNQTPVPVVIARGSGPFTAADVAAAGRLAGALAKVAGVQRVKDLGVSADHKAVQLQVLAGIDLGVLGMPRARAAALSGLASAVVADPHIFGAHHSLDAAITRLRSLPGIGDWTAQYVAMRALNEPDGFPASDLGLLRALNIRDPRKLAAMSQSWRPWRAYAAMYLWQTSGHATEDKPKMLLAAAKSVSAFASATT